MLENKMADKLGSPADNLAGDNYLVAVGVFQCNDVARICKSEQKRCKDSLEMIRESIGCVKRVRLPPVPGANSKGCRKT